jgi:hypothetical protein
MMNFDQLDQRMRIFETAHDQCVLPGILLVARLDGRNFTRLTKELHPFRLPFDEQMRDFMVATTQHLMQCGFRVIYGYTQSDEISLLFHPDEQAFGHCCWVIWRPLIVEYRNFLGMKMWWIIFVGAMRMLIVMH